MSKFFCFTLNNYTAPEVAVITSVAARDDVDYLIFGKEVGENGTPHLQGYIIFNVRKRYGTVKNLIGRRCHVERARGSPHQNRDYCIKDDDFQEFGTLPEATQGRRSDIEQFKEWVKSSEEFPTDAIIADTYPTLFVRYPRLVYLRDLLRPQPALEDGHFGANDNAWQMELYEKLLVPPPDDRQVDFYVDIEGGKGKTWFIRKYLTDHDDAQMLGVGKRDDVAYAIDETKRIFFVNVPRMQMQYLQYGVLESIKDRLIFTTKYQSRTKRLIHRPHVVVFSNEEPDHEKLTADRFNVIHI